MYRYNILCISDGKYLLFWSLFKFSSTFKIEILILTTIICAICRDGSTFCNASGRFHNGLLRKKIILIIDIKCNKTFTGRYCTVALSLFSPSDRIMYIKTMYFEAKSWTIELPIITTSLNTVIKEELLSLVSYGSPYHRLSLSSWVDRKSVPVPFNPSLDSYSDPLNTETLRQAFYTYRISTTILLFLFTCKPVENI